MREQYCIFNESNDEIIAIFNDETLAIHLAKFIPGDICVRPMSDFDFWPEPLNKFENKFLTKHEPSFYERPF